MKSEYSSSLFFVLLLCSITIVEKSFTLHMSFLRAIPPSKMKVGASTNSSLSSNGRITTKYGHDLPVKLFVSKSIANLGRKYPKSITQSVMF